MGQRTPLGINTKDPSLNTAELRAAKKLSPGGTTEPKYFLTKSGYSLAASEKLQKMMPFSARVSRKVVFTETLSMMASTATPAKIFCSSSGIPSLSKVARSEERRVGKE